MDIAILALLLLQLCLGMLTIIISLQHIDGGEMVKFMMWAQAIFTLDGNAAAYVYDAPLLFQLHILLGLTIFILFPFSRLVHMVSAPVRYLWRPGYQVVRSRRQTPLPSRSGAIAPKATASGNTPFTKPAE
jgi:nitrate reductase gamma subunit